MKAIPKFEIIKDKITIKNDINFSNIKSYFKNENKVEFIESDGLKILYKDKWVHIRKSNTEPIIRIISEASNKDIATHLINTIKNIIN